MAKRNKRITRKNKLNYNEQPAQKIEKNPEAEKVFESKQWKTFCKDYNNIFDTYSNVLYDSLNLANSMSSNTSNYTPMTGESYTQDININPVSATQAELTIYLKNPEKYAYKLRGIAQYLENVIMQYKRTVDHFGKLLTFNSDLRPVTRLKDKSAESKKQFESGYDRCLDWLRKFCPRYMFMNKVIPKVMSEGGVFTYLQESKHFADLIEIPSDYCYITGRWDWGFTYAINLAWFDRLIGVKTILPELAEYYKTFVAMREAGLKGSKLAPYQYYPVPVEKGWVFTFDPTKAQVVPPFRGVFKDAMAILDYKNLVKQKATLDTWKIIAQIIPKNKEGEPMIDGRTAMQMAQIVQGVLPSGVKTFATPLEVQELNFQNAQNQNNVIGLGESLYWRSVGVNGTIMDLGEKSAASLRFSLLNDAGFVDHMYFQCENFINLQLYIRSRTYQFRVRYYGNRYTDEDEVTDYANLVRTANMPIGKLYGLAGYEPYEVDSVLDLEDILNWKDRSKPLVSAFNQSSNDKDGGSGGRPKKTLKDLSKAGEDQRDYDSNDNK